MTGADPGPESGDAAKPAGRRRSGKSRPRERHLFPADNNSIHINSPWCPCRPVKRVQHRPTTTVYVHNAMESDPEGPAR